MAEHEEEEGESVTLAEFKEVAPVWSVYIALATSIAWFPFLVGWLKGRGRSG